MKNLRTITMIALVFCVLTFSLTIMDYLALHDIRKDYLSSDIIEYLGLALSKEIPDWTATTGEWQIVGISLLARFFFFIFIMIVLIYYLKKVKYISNSA